MAKLRQDAWSEENDLLLADTVLRHIREGSTQLKAFDEVGDKLNRTSAACGFRWNAIVRNQYQQAIEIAKKQRKQRKKVQFKQENAGTQLKEADTLPQQTGQPTAFPTAVTQNNSGELTLDNVIMFLKRLKENGQSSIKLEHENQRLQSETERLQKENEDLKKQLNRLEKQHATVKEDYQSLMQIMERARKMVVFQEEEQNASSFRMDKNGNLEKIAK
jgi:prespore-specific regulator